MELDNGADSHTLVVISETVSDVVSQKYKGAALSTLLNAQKPSTCAPSMVGLI